MDTGGLQLSGGGLSSPDAEMRHVALRSTASDVVLSAGAARAVLFEGDVIAVASAESSLTTLETRGSLAGRTSWNGAVGMGVWGGSVVRLQGGAGYMTGSTVGSEGPLSGLNMRSGRSVGIRLAHEAGWRSKAVSLSGDGIALSANQSLSLKPPCVSGGGEREWGFK